MTDDNKTRARVLYRLAASDLLRAARDLATAAGRLEAAAREWDPTGAENDCAVLGMAETAGAMLSMAAESSQGMRALLRAAVESGERAAKEQG